MAYQSKYTGLQIDDILDSVEWKQDQIEDLEQIRAGAAKGATALQSYTEKYTGTVTGIKINGTVKSGSGVIDLGTITTDISGKVDKVAGKQLSTEDFTTALKNKLEGLSNYDDTELSNAISTLRGDFDKIVSGDTTTAIKTFNEVIAFLDGLTDTQDLESIIASIEQQIAGKMDKVTLAKVATSGSYNDLSNKPTIPAAVTESTVSGWGFTKNAGTITGVSANGTSVATSGVANIPAASTSAYGVTKLSSATNSTSTTLAATASAVKAAYDLANGKQDKLVSGTNIKNVYTTNNDSSILGSGELHLASVIPSTSKVIATGIWNNYNVIEINTSGITFIPEEEGPDAQRWSIHRSGDGTKFLADDGTYKTISSGGGSSGANIQAVDTGDVLDDVTVNYATKTYVGGLVGDINSVLESIING